MYSKVQLYNSIFEYLGTSIYWILSLQVNEQIQLQRFFLNTKAVVDFHRMYPPWNELFAPFSMDDWVDLRVMRAFFRGFSGVNI